MSNEAHDESPSPDEPRDDEVAARTATSLASGRDPVGGRLAVLTGCGLAASAIPIPVVPGRALRLIRGAIAHDVLARHGLSLVTDARRVLAEPNSQDRMRTLLRRTVEIATRRLLRRLGPLALLTTALTGFEVYALGHLLDRYVRRVRPSGTVRVQEREARRVREAIDAAVLRTFSPAVEASSLRVNEPAEDLRDEFTRWVDTLLLTGATLPNYVERRLEAAFDGIVAQDPDWGEN